MKRPPGTGGLVRHSCRNYFCCVLSVDEPELGVLLDEELELGLDVSDPLVEPEPAVPLPLVEDELDGLDDEAPPPALSFFWMSTEVDEELEPEGGVLGEAVVPLADEEELGAVLGEVVVPEPDGLVVLDELDAPEGEGVRFVSVRLHPASAAAPNARETARANVENFMWPPWLGYAVPSARIGPRMLRSYQKRTTPARFFAQFFVDGAVSVDRGPLPSLLFWKSRC